MTSEILDREESAPMMCSGCHQAVPLGLEACPLCGARVEFPSSKRQSMEVDVRARVLWGDDPEEICADWQKRGAPEAEVRDVLAAALRERRHHFRVRGVQDLLMALGAFAVGAFAAVALYEQAHAEIRIGSRGMAWVMVAAVVGPIAGLALGFRGIRRLAVGGETTEAASDLAEFE